MLASVCGAILLAYLALGAALTQTSLDSIARQLKVTYKVLDNLGDVSTFKFEVKLANQGRDEIAHGGWSIFLCHIRKIKSINQGNANVSHVNGCLHKLTTTSTIAAGGSLTLILTGEFWAVSRTDVMPNWYVAADSENGNIKPRTIVSTTGESLAFVETFSTPQQWKRFSFDRYNPYTAADRFDRNKKPGRGSCWEPVVPVIPKPLFHKRWHWGHVYIAKSWRIAVSHRRLAKLAKYLEDESGIPRGRPKKWNTIRLSIGRVKLPKNKAAKGTIIDQAYRLEIRRFPPGVDIRSPSVQGLFYGVQSFLSIFGCKAKARMWILQQTIIDAPRYAYRGTMLDVSRNFRSKEDVKKLLDLMAAYKLNKFHFHLADDEGWRVEIPGLPELTSVGARRCHDLSENDCIIPQLGSGPQATGLGTGYYSVKDFQEILQHAADRYIDVIPEFDMPGHAHAAIKAMRARFNKYKSTDITKASEYLLDEIDDPSKYESIQYFTDNAINPCIDSTYTFVTKVVTEIKKMYTDVNVALLTYHYGGDEKPRGAWQKSPACLKLKKDKGVNNLSEYFALRVSAITASLGMNMAGWEDGLLDAMVYNRSSFKNNDVIGYAWQNIWEWGVGNRAYLLANAGFKVVMAQATHLYFDHPYEPDPEERGYYWAPRYTDTEKVFGFLPDSLYDNIEEKRSGEPYTKKDLCANIENCTPLNKPENILGLQAAIWSETIRTTDQLWSMATPRLLAFAERAWHKADWEFETDEKKRRKSRSRDWERFSCLLGKNALRRLDKNGYTYHLPPPGARANCAVLNDVLYANSAISGLEIEFSQDGGATWCTYHPYVTVKGGNIMLRTRSTDNKRKSRTVSFQMKAASDF